MLPTPATPFLAPPTRRAPASRSLPGGREERRAAGAGRWLAVLALGLLPLAAPAEAAAQPAGGDEVLSSALTREALAILAAGETDAAARAAREAAAVLLDLSAELTPAAAETQWLRADLAERRGDSATLRDALGAYLRERPRDDAALLKAALVRVSEAQTLDGRLERMQDILDRSARGGAATAPMRSRLALLASEAATELGDEGRAVSLLGTAAGLDPANGPAAAGVYGRLARGGASAKSLGAAAANWVFAAPVDPTPRVALARVLAGEGAAATAAEQYDRAALFSGATPLPARDFARWAAALTVDNRAGEARSLVESAAERLGPIGGGPGIDPPADLLGLDLLRLALSEAGGEGRAMDRVLDRLDAAVATGGPDQRLDARLDRAWIQAALATRPLAEAEQALEQAGGRYADADPRRELAAGWIALRSDDPAAAAKAFDTADDLAMARLGKSRTLAEGDPQRVQILRELATGGSGPAAQGDLLAATLAAQRLLEENREVQPTAIGRVVLDAMAERPSSLWRMDVMREPLVSLEVAVDPARVEPFQPSRLMVTIANRSRLPVALGADQTLRPVVFAGIALFEDEVPVGSLPTQVFNVGRRLTLPAGEEMTVPARLDHGPIGRRLAGEPGRSFRVGISVTLDPRLAPDGSVAIGPLGAVDTLRSVPATGEPATEDAVRGWLDAMSGDAPGAEYAALIRLAMLQGGAAPAGDAPGKPIGPRLLNDAADLLAERGPKLDSVPLALCGLYLRTGTRPGPAVEQLLAAARSSRVDLVRVSTLLGQVRDPTDPALDAAARAGSPRLRAFADAWTRVLRERDPESSRTGASLAP